MHAAKTIERPWHRIPPEEPATLPFHSIVECRSNRNGHTLLPAAILVT